MTDVGGMEVTFIARVCISSYTCVLPRLQFKACMDYQRSTFGNQLGEVVPTAALYPP